MSPSLLIVASLILSCSPHRVQASPTLVSSIFSSTSIDPSTFNPALVRKLRRVENTGIILFQLMCLDFRYLLSFPRSSSPLLLAQASHPLAGAHSFAAHRTSTHHTPHAIASLHTSHPDCTLRATRALAFSPPPRPSRSSRVRPPLVARAHRAPRGWSDHVGARQTHIRPFRGGP